MLETVESPRGSVGNQHFIRRVFGSAVTTSHAAIPLAPELARSGWTRQGPPNRYSHRWHPPETTGMVRERAEVAELADAADSKSAARKGVGVRFPSSAFLRLVVILAGRVSHQAPDPQLG